MHRLSKFMRTWVINGPDWVLGLLVWWYGPSRPRIERTGADGWTAVSADEIQDLCRLRDPKQVSFLLTHILGRQTGGNDHMVVMR
jgi:hypothetical protein